MPENSPTLTQSPPGDPPVATPADDLFVEDLRFSIVPEWVIDAEISDSAFRVYSLLLRYGNSSGRRMPSRRRLADRLHRSVASVDRAMRELEDAAIVRVEHRRAGRENLTNRYHVRTSNPIGSPPDSAGTGGGLKFGATPTGEGRGGLKSEGTLASNLGPYREIFTEKPPPPSPSARTGRRRSAVRDELIQPLLAQCGIESAAELAERCRVLRRGLGRPTARWSEPCLVAAIQLAVRVRHWPPELVVPAVLAVAGDPATQTPARLAEAGPWWDSASPLLPAWNPTELAALEVRLVATDGRRPLLQAQARTELAAEGQPLTRESVARRACELLDRNPVASVVDVEVTSDQWAGIRTSLSSRARGAAVNQSADAPRQDASRVQRRGGVLNGAGIRIGARGGAAS